jgi:hypothetical protein
LPGCSTTTPCGWPIAQARVRIKRDRRYAATAQLDPQLLQRFTRDARSSMPVWTSTWHSYQWTSRRPRGREAAQWV